MKKFTSLLIGCTLALAGVALAQQPEDQPTPAKKGKHGKEKTQTSEAQPGANTANPESTGAMKQRGMKHERAGSKGMKTEENTANPEATGAMKQRGMKHERAGSKMMKDAEANTANPEATAAMKQRGAKKERAGSKGMKTETMPKTETTVNADTNVSGQADSSAIPEGKKGRKGKNARGVNAKPMPSTTPATAEASAAPEVAATGQEKMKGKGKGAAKKLEPQKVEQIKSQHANFKAEPKPDRVPTVTFTQNYRIEGSDRWEGPQYEVYRSYHPERHDHSWYHSRYNRVELIGGGYYYFNNGYWYPAWGYNPSVEYYAYNGPIYVGHRALPPDRVIADVQAALQEMGYYRGEVDGLLGPLTREALTNYQDDQGLIPTAAIDEPTLDSLGMG